MKVFLGGSKGPNEHKSTYDLEELAKAGLITEIRKKLPQANAPVLWNNRKLTEATNGFPQIDYSAYVSNPAVLNQALESILKYGAVIIKNVSGTLFKLRWKGLAY